MTKDTFVIEDSGKREEFASGMVRDVTTGKIEYDRIMDGPMYERWAAHLTKGAVKYPDVKPGVSNWTLADGLPELVHAMKSLSRHHKKYMENLKAFLRGAPFTSVEDEAAAIFFNINEIEFIRERMAKDSKVS